MPGRIMLIGLFDDYYMFYITKCEWCRPFEYHMPKESIPCNVDVIASSSRSGEGMGNIERF